MNSARRAAFYLRVSAGEQTTENQRRELAAAAEQAGWVVSEVYEDAASDAAKNCGKRPALQRLLKDATRRRFDVVAAWSVERLGRNLHELVAFLATIHRFGMDLYLHRQGIDTSTPAGGAIFQTLDMFAEFERTAAGDRVKAGLARARARGKTLGRPRTARAKEEAIKASLAAGAGILKTARTLGVGVSVVQRVKAGFLPVG